VPTRFAQAFPKKRVTDGEQDSEAREKPRDRRGEHARPDWRERPVEREGGKDIKEKGMERTGEKQDRTRST
jgi:hypothetical protein